MCARWLRIWPTDVIIISGGHAFRSQGHGHADSDNSDNSDNSDTATVAPKNNYYSRQADANPYVATGKRVDSARAFRIIG